MSGERKRKRVWEHIVKKGVQGKLLPHGAGPDVLGPRSLHDGLCTFPRKWPRLSASHTWYTHGQYGAQNHSRRHRTSRRGPVGVHVRSWQ
jgi:hypothetical protein